MFQRTNDTSGPARKRRLAAGLASSVFQSAIDGPMQARFEALDRRLEHAVFHGPAPWVAVAVGGGLGAAGSRAARTIEGRVPSRP